MIAEIKFASPSAGLIRDDKNVGAIAKSYEESGAACLSVLTDERFFQGQDQYLLEAKEQVALPVLRKDFIIDEYQIWESRLLSADCILLIAAALTDEQLTIFYRLEFQIQLYVLFEVHDMDEFKLALQFKNAILGVNNRNLKSFEVDLTLSHQLQRKLPRGRWLVTESGIRERDDVLKMQEKGIYAFLVGSSLMSAELPGVALKALFYP